MRRLLSTEHHLALARINPRRDGRSQVIVVRRDTFELEWVESVAALHVDELRHVASARMSALRKPTGWNAPHRKCIAYFLKMRRKREEIFDLLQRPQADRSAVVSVLLRNEAYALHLSKKVNSLSGAERRKLLTPSGEELLPERSTTSIDVLDARSQLYRWLVSPSPSIVQAHRDLLELIRRRAPASEA